MLKPQRHTGRVLLSLSLLLCHSHTLTLSPCLSIALFLSGGYFNFSRFSPSKIALSHSHTTQLAAFTGCTLYISVLLLYFLFYSFFFAVRLCFCSLFCLCRLFVEFFFAPLSFIAGELYISSIVWMGLT